MFDNNIIFSLLISIISMASFYFISEKDEENNNNILIAILSHFWVSLLEKAYVKFIFSPIIQEQQQKTNNNSENQKSSSSSLYECIRKGSFSDAIFHLTGIPCVSLKSKLYSSIINHSSKNKNQKKETTTSKKSKKQKQDDVDNDENIDDKEKENIDEIWKELEKNLNNGSILFNICTSKKHHESRVAKQLRQLRRQQQQQQQAEEAAAASSSSSSSSSDSDSDEEGEENSNIQAGDDVHQSSSLVKTTSPNNQQQKQKQLLKRRQRQKQQDGDILCGMRLGHSYAVTKCFVVLHHDDDNSSSRKRRILILRDPALSLEKPKKLQQVFRHATREEEFHQQSTTSLFQLDFDKLVHVNNNNNNNSSACCHYYPELYFQRGSVWLGFTGLKCIHKQELRPRVLVSNVSSSSCSKEGDGELENNNDIVIECDDILFKDFLLPEEDKNNNNMNKFVFHLRQFVGNDVSSLNVNDDDEEDDISGDCCYRAIRLEVVETTKKKNNDKKNTSTTKVLATSSEKFQRRQDVLLELNMNEDTNLDYLSSLKLRVVFMKKDSNLSLEGQRFMLLAFGG